MKNYSDNLVIRQRGLTEVPIEEYKDSWLDMKEFVESMSPILKAAKCGWSGVKYKVMENPLNESKEIYMVLYVGEYPERWIPISGNSKGCNFSVLGENIW